MIFVYLGIGVGGLIGLEMQDRYNSYRRRRKTVMLNEESEQRVKCLWVAIHEQSVRDEADRQGIDVDQVLTDLESGVLPSVSEHQLAEVLRQALDKALSPAGRASIQRLVTS